MFLLLHTANPIMKYGEVPFQNVYEYETVGNWMEINACIDCIHVLNRISGKSFLLCNEKLNLINGDD